MSRVERLPRLGNFRAKRGADDNDSHLSVLACQLSLLNSHSS